MSGYASSEAVAKSLAEAKVEYEKLLVMDPLEAYAHFVKLGFVGDALQEAMAAWGKATGNPMWYTPIPTAGEYKVNYEYLVAQHKKPKPVKSYHTSLTDEWGTPNDFFAWLDNLYHFTLDVCADHTNHKCEEYITKAMNALEIDWWGRVFMNPPFSQVAAFMKELGAAVKTGEIELGVALVAARPDTQWWWHACQLATEVWFLKGRLKFQGAPDPAPFPSAVLVYWPGHVRERVALVDWRGGKTLQLGDHGFIKWPA